MKTLYLLRHADTETVQPEGSDHDRLLTDKGRRQAVAVRDFLQSMPFPPGHVLASDSARTKETATIVRTGNILFTRDLYLSPAAKILAALQAIGQAHDHVLIVAHNPGIAELASHLSSDSPDVEDFPPATLAVFTVETDDWYMLEPETAFLNKVFKP